MSEIWNSFALVDSLDYLLFLHKYIFDTSWGLEYTSFNQIFVLFLISSLTANTDFTNVNNEQGLKLRMIPLFISIMYSVHFLLIAFFFFFFETEILFHI